MAAKLQSCCGWIRDAICLSLLMCAVFMITARMADAGTAPGSSQLVRTEHAGHWCTGFVKHALHRHWSLLCPCSICPRCATRGPCEVPGWQCGAWPSHGCHRRQDLRNCCRTRVTASSDIINHGIIRATRVHSSRACMYTRLLLCLH